jgi:hypothetical protein
MLEGGWPYSHPVDSFDRAPEPRGGAGLDHQTADLDFVKLCHWNKAMKPFSAPTKPF